MKIGRLEISIMFAWFDLWVGFYVEPDLHIDAVTLRTWRYFYICVVPCFPIRLTWWHA